jgi:hypothetical protein
MAENESIEPKSGYRIRNWKKHQHFKDRRPPWIKLYRDILDDPQWNKLDGESAKTLVMLWLIASEDKTQAGQLPNIETIAFRLRISQDDVMQTLANLKDWVICDDIKMISTGYQLGSPETETETEERQRRVEGDYGAEAPSPPPDSNPPSKQPKPKTFKTWTADEFFDECNRIHDSRHILTDRQGTEFYSYWTEPTASGRIKVNTQTTWDTARRMHNWRKIDDERTARNRR